MISIPLEESQTLYFPRLGLSPRYSGSRSVEVQILDVFGAYAEMTVLKLYLIYWRNAIDRKPYILHIEIKKS